MRPNFNSPQVRTTNNAPSPQQQQQQQQQLQHGMPFNPALANMLQNSMQMQTNSSTHPSFMNMQNNHMHTPMSQFRSFDHPNVGFCPPQNNMNLASSYPLMGQNVNQNMGFLPAQLFGHNLLMNQNVALPYGQFGLPNLSHLNQVMPMQNPCQGGPNYAFGGSNQAPHAIGVQNPTFFATPKFGNMQSPNQGGQQINQNQQNMGFRGTQGNNMKIGGIHNSNSEGKSSPSKSFTKHPKKGAQLQGGFQNSHFHHNKNAKGKFAFPNGNRGKGASNEEEGKFTLANSMNQGRERRNRSISLSYTEQEIQQWREERRKNFPSKTNIEKKLSEKMIDSEAIEREARIRREQLKEILTKQAEMGVEVAEIPSHYLSDSRKQGCGIVENRSESNNRRLINKFGKRERYNKKDRFAKKQGPNHKDPSNDHSSIQREPTLLQKLLSSDIRRDKIRLRQVFRFMVTNSFFKDFLDKPLKFPTVVVVKESVSEESVAIESPSVAGKKAYKGRDKFMVERGGNNDYEDGGDDCYDDNDVEDEVGIEEPEEEEGEIIN